MSRSVQCAPPSVVLSRALFDMSNCHYLSLAITDTDTQTHRRTECCRNWCLPAYLTSWHIRAFSVYLLHCVQGFSCRRVRELISQLIHSTVHSTTQGRSYRDLEARASRLQVLLAIYHDGRQRTHNTQQTIQNKEKGNKLQIIKLTLQLNINCMITLLCCSLTENEMNNIIYVHRWP